MSNVIVVVGAGQIGQAIARRVGVAKHILLADKSPDNAKAAAEVLGNAGYEASVATVDVSSRETVRALVDAATRLGDVMGLIHAAGVSPSQASPASILKVDLYGTALVLEEFGNVIARGGAGVVIASQSGHRLPPLSVEQNKALATTPVEELLRLPFLQPNEVKDSLHAYQLSKRGNSLRVMAEAVRWGKRGARVNTHQPRDHHDAAREGRADRAARRGVPPHDRAIGGQARRHARRGGDGRRAPHGCGRCVHHRQRLSHGWGRHRSVLVRRAEHVIDDAYGNVPRSSARLGGAGTPCGFRFEDRAEPTIVKPTDAVIRIAATCVCGSDLWPYRRAQPITMPMRVDGQER